MGVYKWSAVDITNMIDAKEGRKKMWINTDDLKTCIDDIFSEGNLKQRLLKALGLQKREE